MLVGRRSNCSDCCMGRLTVAHETDALSPPVQPSSSQRGREKIKRQHELFLLHDEASTRLGGCRSILSTRLARSTAKLHPNLLPLRSGLDSYVFTLAEAETLKIYQCKRIEAVYFTRFESASTFRKSSVNAPIDSD